MWDLFRRYFSGYFSAKSKDIKRCIYIKIKGESIANLSKNLERYLSSKNIRPLRFVEPECYIVTELGNSLYESDPVIEVIELEGELSRMLYLFSGKEELDFKLENSKITKFIFEIMKKEGLTYLLKLICQRKIGVKRHEYRSGITFLFSLIIGFASSWFFKVDEYLDYLLLTLAITTFVVLVTLVIDYPFSLLKFRGVRVVEDSEITKVLRDKIKKIKR